MKYALRATTKNDGEVYYVNSIMVTDQIECAEHFEPREDAEDYIERFRMLFKYETPKIDIVEVDESCL